MCVSGRAWSNRRVSQTGLPRRCLAPRYGHLPQGLQPSGSVTHPSYPRGGESCRADTREVGPGPPSEQDLWLGRGVPSKGLYSESEIQLQKQTPEINRLGFMTGDETLCSLKTSSWAKCFFSSQTALVDKYYHAQGPSNTHFSLLLLLPDSTSLPSVIYGDGKHQQ